MTQYDVVIVGAGAAGLMCAIEAGKRQRRVLVIDHAKAVGEKIRISGGGRCNFTNRDASPAQYLSQNPHFCISALTRYRPSDFIALVERYGIAYHEKTLGQLFCDGSSKQIIAMLLAECRDAGVEIWLESSVSRVAKEAELFHIAVSDARTVLAESLVIATGGPSIPKMGATTWGYQIATQFGHSLVEPRAALVPLTFTGALHEAMQGLAGTSIHARVTCNGVSFEEGLLFTHRGLSGPVILQISSYWQESTPIVINFVPKVDDFYTTLQAERARDSKRDIVGLLASYIPKRLAQYIAEREGYRGNLAELSNKTLQSIAKHVCSWEIIPSGTEGYRTAEVTLGGVNTQELSSATLESKRVAGLYFIGEVVDVTGHLGGYNFQWAWSSAYAAGQSV